MPNNVIELVVKTVDQASAPLQEITKAVSSVKEAIIAGIGGEAVVESFRTFVDNTEEAETAAARLGISIKNSVEGAFQSLDELRKFSSEAGISSIFSAAQVDQAQAALSRFDRVFGDTFERARKDAIDLASATGRDLPSAAEALGRALESPALGLRVLNDLGVHFDTTQRELISTLDRTGHSLDAQKIILDAVEKSSSGAADTVSNTLGGAFKRLGNAISEAFKSDAPGTLTKSVNATADAINGLNKKLEETKNLRGDTSNARLNSTLLQFNSIAAPLSAERFAQITSTPTPLDFVARGGRNRASVGGDFIPQEVLDQQAADTRAAQLKALQEFVPSVTQSGSHFLDLSGVDNTLKEKNDALAESITHVSDAYEKEYARLTAAQAAPSLFNVTPDQANKALSDFLDKALPEFETPNQQAYQNQRVAQGLPRVATQKLEGEKLPSGAPVISTFERQTDDVINDLSDKLIALGQQGQLTGESIAESLVKELRDQTIKSAINDLAKYLKDALHDAIASSEASGGGGFLGALIGAFGGGGGGSSSGAMNNISVDDYIAATGAPGHAVGGDFSGLSIVGENGPELVAGKGRIFNAQQLGSAMGGMGTSYSPTTTIIVGKGGDSDSSNNRKLAALLDYKLAQNNQVMMNNFAKLMKDNGYGRLRT